MQKKFSGFFVGVLCSAVLLISSVIAVAEPAPENGAAPVALPPLIITEVQTGAGAGEATKEFIELCNTSGTEIALDPEEGEAWQLWYMPSSRTQVTGSSDYTAIVLEGIIPAGGHFLIAKNYADKDQYGVVDVGGYLAGAKINGTYTATRRVVQASGV